MNTILARMLMSFVAFVFLLAGIFAVTIVVTGKQKDDGLIVNLAGRQSMLAQKMTKEALLFSSIAGDSGKADESEESSAQLQLTMKAFDATLSALKDGGSAPLDLQMTRFRQSPPAATQPIRNQLEKVAELWLPFQTSIQRVIDSKGQDTGAFDYVLTNNVELLSLTNEVVSLVQSEAERKVALILRILGVAIIIGVMLCLGSIYAINMTVVEPIQEIIEAAEVMSTGDLKHELKSSGLTEIQALASSINRMRISLNKIMERL